MIGEIKMNCQDIHVLFAKEDMRRVLRWYMCLENEGQDCIEDRHLFMVLRAVYETTFGEEFKGCYDD